MAALGATVRSVNAEARFIPNGPPTMKSAGELAAIQFTDNQARRGLTPPWNNGRRAKEYRAVMGRRPIGGIFSVGVEEPYRWKDSVQSAPEIELWVAEGTANGQRPWVTKFSGVLYDRRWLPTVERIYQWHARHERYLRNEAPLARIGLLFSEQTARHHRGMAAGDRAEDHVLGMYHGLLEARLPFELVHEAFLTADRLDRFKVLVLADAAALSEAQCSAIRDYVQRGGSLVATFASSLFDEFGQRRTDFGLADVFGVSFGGGRRDDAELLSEPGSSPGATACSVAARLEDAPHHQWRYRIEGRPPTVPITLDPVPVSGLPMRTSTPGAEGRRGALSARHRPNRVEYVPWTSTHFGT